MSTLPTLEIFLSTCVNNYSFLSHLKNSSLFFIYLQSAPLQEVLTLINILKQIKTSGHDDSLAFSFFELTGNIITYRTHFINLNCCLTCGIFPNKFKFAKLIPIFIKGWTDLIQSIVEFRFCQL